MRPRLVPRGTRRAVRVHFPEHHQDVDRVPPPIPGTGRSRHGPHRRIGRSLGPSSRREIPRVREHLRRAHQKFAPIKVARPAAALPVKIQVGSRRRRIRNTAAWRRTARGRTATVLHGHGAAPSRWCASRPRRRRRIPTFVRSGERAGPRAGGEVALVYALTRAGLPPEGRRRTCAIREQVDIVDRRSRPVTRACCLSRNAYPSWAT